MRYKYTEYLTLFFAPSPPSIDMFTSPSANTSPAVLRLWCKKNVSRAERRNAPIVLASIKRRYASVLVEANVQDLAFMCVFFSISLQPPSFILTRCTHHRTSRHSYDSDHLTVRGFNPAGWLSFTIHCHPMPLSDEIWLYHVKPNLSGLLFMVVKLPGRFPVITQLLYPSNLEDNNFVPSLFRSVSVPPLAGHLA